MYPPLPPLEPLHRYKLGKYSQGNTHISIDSRAFPRTALKVKCSPIRQDGGTVPVGKRSRLRRQKELTDKRGYHDKATQ